jgi:hypothetical protein
MATPENSRFFPYPNADLPTRLRCALFNILWAPGFPFLHRLAPIPRSKFFVLHTGEEERLTILNKYEQRDAPDYITPSLPDATWLRVEVKTGSRRVHLNTKLNYTIVAGVLVLDEKLEPLTAIIHVRFDILSNGNGEVMHDRCYWGSLVGLLKTLILTKYGWKGEIKEQGLPYFLTTGDGMVS